MKLSSELKSTSPEGVWKCDHFHTLTAKNIGQLDFINQFLINFWSVTFPPPFPAVFFFFFFFSFFIWCGNIGGFPPVFHQQLWLNQSLPAIFYVRSEHRNRWQNLSRSCCHLVSRLCSRLKKTFVDSRFSRMRIKLTWVTSSEICYMMQNIHVQVKITQGLRKTLLWTTVWPRKKSQNFVGWLSLN